MVNELFRRARSSFRDKVTRDRYRGDTTLIGVTRATLMKNFRRRYAITFDLAASREGTN